jgi:hypothetical protein
MPSPTPSQRSLRWARIRELGEAIMGGGDDPALRGGRARELVRVLRGLEERGPGPPASACGSGGCQCGV